MRIWERSLSRAYQLISFSWDKTKYLFSRYGLVKFENERWKILEIEKKKMKTKSEMKLEKIKLMKDQLP